MMRSSDHRWKMPPALAAVLCAVMVTVLMVGNAFTPANIVVAALAGVPLILGIWVGRPWFVWLMALVVVVATLAFYVWGPAPTVPQVTWVALVNRLIACTETLVIAGLVHLQIRRDKALATQRQLLEDQYQELEAINKELSEREQEIVRQNAELQTQAEELERRTQELQLSNQDLMHWE